MTVDGVHCAACVFAIEDALRGAADEVSVNAASRRVRVVFRPDAHPLSELMTRIARLGYRPRPLARRALAGAEAAGRRTALWRMLVAVLCMMQVMMYAWPRYVAGAGEMPADLWRVLVWAEWMLTVPVLVFASWPFLRGAGYDLRNRRIGMDVPVALGIIVMFVASSVAFLLVSRWLEASARERALGGLADLLARLPDTVDRLEPDGTVREVTLRTLRIGDRVRVSVGQSVPADSVVESGASHADESLLTGESAPIPKRPGDAVAAGSLNLSGPLVVRLQRAPGESRLAEIVALIDAASASRPRLARLADRIAGPFLVAVMLLAAAAWVGWQFIDPTRALWVAVSVLIVTCPCALSLATPVALLAAAGSLARQGLLVRSTQAIETLARIDTFVFDKTGTLTLDRLALARVDPLGRPTIDPPRALAIAAALEAGSLHPIGRALVAACAADRTSLEVADLVEHGGAGIAARVRLNGRWHEARIGRADFAAAGSQAGGVVLALDGAPVARFEFAETLRPDAGAALRALAADGAAIAMLSGDERSRVARVAALLGVADHQAQATPEDKLARIVALQREGRRVAMVGDGINDAPVLARADLSVAFATGAPLAQHHADLLLLGERMGALIDARRLARRTLRVITQNLAFAALYNAISIPLALAGLMPPWLAGLGMAASALVVVANALRLARPVGAAASAPVSVPARG
jgi:Cu2+-exporting ATPase